MQIVSSTLQVGPAQKCGRRYTAETHVGDDGSVFTAEYLAGNDVDRAAVMAARAVEIAAAVDARDAEKIEREDAQAAVDMVLKAAVKDGKLSGEVMGKAGYAVVVAEAAAENLDG